MSSTPEVEKEKFKIALDTVHYVTTFIFFLLILTNIIALTIGTFNMEVNSDDENAVTAKNLMTAAYVITYVFLLLILIFLGICYSFRSYESPEAKSAYDKLMKKTGGENIFMSMRIVTFSILTFISLLASALCLQAATYIEKSDDPDQYDEQYNLCRELGKAFMTHFIIFSIIQICGYIKQYLLQNCGMVTESKADVTKK